MSYTVNAYMVSMERLERILGSKDRSLLDEITSAHAASIADHNDGFKEEIRDGLTPLERALADLINGEPVTAAQAFQYWFAVELIAEHVGQRVMVPALVGVNSSYLDEVDAVLGEPLQVPPDLRLAALLERTPSLGIPAPYESAGVGFLTATESAQLARTLDGVDPDDLDGNEEVLDGVAEYANMIDAASAAGSDLLLFYY